MDGSPVRVSVGNRENENRIDMNGWGLDRRWSLPLTKHMDGEGLIAART